MRALLSLSKSFMTRCHRHKSGRVCLHVPGNIMRGFMFFSPFFPRKGLSVPIRIFDSPGLPDFTLFLFKNTMLDYTFSKQCCGNVAEVQCGPIEPATG